MRHAGSGRETSEQLAQGRPDLVLLDVMLPDESGFEICRRLRRDSNVPVLFLSARDSDADKIRGLGLGGDDYIVKSATPAEVVARVKAVLRRASPAGGLQRLRFGELEVDLAAHEVNCEGRRIELTAREFALLARARRASATGVQPRPAVRAGLGLVRRPQRGRGVHRPPAAEDRARPGEAALHRHGLGRRLPARSRRQMRRPPIRIRTFILGTVLVLLLLPALAGGAAWLIERDRQQADIQPAAERRRRLPRLPIALEHAERATVQGFARLLGRLDLLAQLVIATDSPPGKTPALRQPGARAGPAFQKQQPALRNKRHAGPPQRPRAHRPTASSALDRRPSTAHRSRDAESRRPPLAVDLYYRPASRATRALVALVSGVLVLLAGLAVAVWLAGRWMVAPLARLSAQVDKVAGGDLTIAVPRSRIGEIANIAQAVEGMTAALGETAQRRAEADEARRFLVTSVAHDLRTPLFALRGHLQAIGSRARRPGRPSGARRSESRRARTADRQPLRLHPRRLRPAGAPARSVRWSPTCSRRSTAGLEHTARLRDNTFDLDGDRALGVIVDRDRFKRALTNILDNALRYSPPGAPIHLGWAATDRVDCRDHRPGPRARNRLRPPPAHLRTRHPRSSGSRASPTAAPGSASRSPNASSNTSTPPSPPATNRPEAQSSASPSDNHCPAAGSAAGIVERLSDLRGRERAVRRRQARLHDLQNCR